MSYLKILCPIVLSCCAALSYAQTDTLRLSWQEYEAIFLKQNLPLLAERLNIQQAEANVIQARLWPNPTISVEDVNPFATQKQLSIAGEGLPPWFGDRFGRNLQVAVNFEQLILTAGKRKKLVALESVSVEMAQQYFEDLLRQLKVEFRSLLNQLQYQQTLHQLTKDQHTSVAQLTELYQKQVEKSNIRKSDYLRLKVLEIEIASQQTEIEKEINRIQAELKKLMNMNGDLYLDITGQVPAHYIPLRDIPVSTLTEKALENRPDARIASLGIRYSEQQHTYEQAIKKPDVTVKGVYDRGSNFMLNFFGVGAAIDLPVFNRNQGNIKNAAIGIQKAQILSEQKQLDIKVDVELAYTNLLTAIRFLHQVKDGWTEDISQVLEGYRKNLIGRNISLLEYLDFLDAYLRNKKLVLEAEKDLIQKAEELQYQVGTEIL